MLDAPAPQLSAWKALMCAKNSPELTKLQLRPDEILLI